MALNPGNGCVRVARPPAVGRDSGVCLAESGFQLKDAELRAQVWPITLHLEAITLYPCPSRGGALGPICTKLKLARGRYTAGLLMILSPIRQPEFYTVLGLRVTISAFNSPYEAKYASGTITQPMGV